MVTVGELNRDRIASAETLHGLLCVLAMGLSGCGTVVNGFHQDLAVTSEPGGSRVSIDDIPSGTTPLVAPLRRGHAHVVKVGRDGYYPVEASVVPNISGWNGATVFLAV